MAGLLGILSEAFMNSPETYAALPDLGVKFFDTPGSKVNGYVPEESRGLLSKLALMGGDSAQKYEQQSKLASLAPRIQAGDKSALLELATINPQAASALAQFVQQPEYKVQEINGQLVRFNPNDPNAKAEVIFGGGGNIDPKLVKGEGDLRAEFDNQQKSFRVIQSSFKNIDKIAKAEPTATNDMALVYSIMKMYDPNSVVRETEYATAQNAAGVPQRVQTMWNSLIDGQKLAPEQRKQFLSTAKDIYSTQAGLFNDSAKKYRKLAKEYGYDPERITEEVVIEESPAPSVKEGATATNPKTGQKIIFRGGKWGSI